MIPKSDAARARFIQSHTEILAPPLVPEIQLHLASEVIPLWQATEEQLTEKGLPPPFWAFAWAGGQALARYLLDHPEVVEDKVVLDFGSGSGLQGIAAKMAGASKVLANDLDPFACQAATLNAGLNGVSLEVTDEDVIGQTAEEWDVILAGDVCYEGPLAERIETWLRQLAKAERSVLLGDPGRTYLPRQGMERLIAYGVKTSRELEDTDVRNAVVWRVLAR